MDKFLKKVFPQVQQKPPALPSLFGLNALFDKVVYINLPERKNKQRHMEKLLNDLGIKAERVDGVSDSNRRRGCALAHLGILRSLRDSNFQSVLIFEDDIRLFKNCSLQFPEFNFEWNMLFFGITRPRWGNQKFGRSQRLLGGRCTHAYAVNKNCVDFLIQRVEAKVDSVAVDIIYERVFPKLLVYCVPIFGQMKRLGSDIRGRRSLPSQNNSISLRGKTPI